MAEGERPPRRQKDPPVCSFCGKPQDQVQHLIQGQFGYFICDGCIELCREIVQERSAAARGKAVAGLRILPPREIHRALDEYVVGQDHVKRVLSVAVYNHYKRIGHNATLAAPKAGSAAAAPAGSETVEIEKSNILLIGPTGSGKTLLASTLARTVNVPFAIADATTLTEAGYVGDDVENILLRLIQNADFDIERAERGIIFIDEIDKISRKSESTSITRDVSGEGVQQALLKILEGTVASVPAKGGRKHPQAQNLTINTKDILFICGGAFVELENIIRQRMDTKLIGFKREESAGEVPRDRILGEASPDDLIKFGLIPELVGRLPVLGALHELSDAALREILVRPRNALLKQYQQLLRLEGIELDFSDDAIAWVIERAQALKTGARGLRAVLERLMIDVLYEAPELKTKKIHITREKIDKNDLFGKARNVA